MTRHPIRWQTVKSLLSESILLPIIYFIYFKTILNISQPSPFFPLQIRKNKSKNKTQQNTISLTAETKMDSSGIRSSNGNRLHSSLSKNSENELFLVKNPMCKSRNRRNISGVISTLDGGFRCADYLEMKKYLYLLLGKVEGLFCILITDRDGVPILEVSTNKAPDYAMRPSFISTFGKATDQGSKLGLGKNKLVISIYTSYQVVQISKLPMVITFIASKDSNTGHILSLEDHINPLLNDLKCAIIEP